jgi:probable HAF family extracellular repeat protein
MLRLARPKKTPTYPKSFYERSTICLLTCLVPLVCIANSRAASIQDLGTLGGDASYATSVNNKGQVVGQAKDVKGDWHMFKWENGQMIDVSKLNNLALDGPHEVTAINDNGQIAAVLPNGTAAILTVGTTTSLGIAGFSAAFAINNDGQAVGYFWDATFSHAFTYSNGRVTSLAPYANSVAFGVNDFGVIVGRGTDNIHKYPYHAVIWSNGTTTNLFADEVESEAYDVNASGTVVGEFWTGSVGRSFVWQNGQLQTFGTGLETAAFAVNDSGTVVGLRSTQPCRFCPGEARAFVWQNGQLFDLNDLLPQGSGWVLERASDINNTGSIVGRGTINGEIHGFLWQP